MLNFAKNTRTTIRIEGPSQRQRVIFLSFAGTVDHEETMPDFHSAGWASWCAFRLLHPVELNDFENELSALFALYKGGEPWITYNEAKRALLQRYLSQPYHQPRKRK